MRLRRTISCGFVGSVSDVFFWIVIMWGMMWRFIMIRRGGVVILDMPMVSMGFGCGLEWDRFGVGAREREI